jgi:hypothetical protein
MSDPLAASDLWPPILGLPHDERVRLDEFSSNDAPLAWNGRGWAELGAPHEGAG